MTATKIDYIPIEGTDTDAINVLEGPYEGLHFHYGTVKFEELDDGRMKMHFDYVILKKPDEFEESEDFKQFAGDLLVQILEEQLPSLTQEAEYGQIDDPPAELQENLESLKKEQEELRANAANGTDDSSTSDSQ